MLCSRTSTQTERPDAAARCRPQTHLPITPPYAAYQTQRSAAQIHPHNAHMQRPEAAPRCSAQMQRPIVAANSIAAQTMIA